MNKRLRCEFQNMLQRNKQEELKLEDKQKDRTLKYWCIGLYCIAGPSSRQWSLTEAFKSRTVAIKDKTGKSSHNQYKRVTRGRQLETWKRVKTTFKREPPPTIRNQARHAKSYDDAKPQNTDKTSQKMIFLRFSVGVLFPYDTSFKQ